MKTISVLYLCFLYFTSIVKSQTELCPIFKDITSSIAGVRYIEIKNPRSYLQISQIVARDENGNNVAKGKSATGSGNYGGGSNPSFAVDGTESARNYPQIFCSIQNGGGWIRVDLGSNFNIKSIEIYNRSDCCGERLIGAQVFLKDSLGNNIQTFEIKENQTKYVLSNQQRICLGVKPEVESCPIFKDITSSIAGVRYIEIKNPRSYLQISQIVARDENGNNVAKGKSATGSGNYGGGSNPSFAVDGTESARNYPQIFCSIQNGGGWIRVDLGSNFNIKSIEIYNRSDCCGERLIGAQVILNDSLGNNIQTFEIKENQPKYVLSNQQRICSGVKPEVELCPIFNDIPSSTPGVRYIEITNPRSYLQISQIVARDENGNNVAKGKSATGSGNYGGGSNPSFAVDGTESARNYPQIFCSIQNGGGWIRVDLGSNFNIKSIEIYNRSDCCGERLIGAQVFLKDSLGNNIQTLEIKENQPKIVLSNNYQQRICFGV